MKIKLSYQEIINIIGDHLKSKGENVTSGKLVFRHGDTKTNWFGRIIGEPEPHEFYAIFKKKDDIPEVFVTKPQDKKADGG